MKKQKTVKKRGWLVAQLKLEQWKEKKLAEWYAHVERCTCVSETEKRRWTDNFLDTYAQELLGLVRESVVPEEADEADGWEMLGNGESCCPGDDAADGFNACRAQIEANFERLVEEIDRHIEEDPDWDGKPLDVTPT